MGSTEIAPRLAYLGLGNMGRVMLSLMIPLDKTSSD